MQNILPYGLNKVYETIKWCNWFLPHRLSFCIYKYSMAMCLCSALPFGIMVSPRPRSSHWKPFNVAHSESL